MPEYQLYCFAQSGNAYRVALMLNLIGADWRPIFVDYFDKVEPRTPEYRAKVNEMGEVPVLAHGERKLSQSAVCLTYLAERFGKFQPQGEDERLEALRWIIFDNQKVGGFLGPYRYLRSLAPTPGDPAVLAFLKGRLDNSLAIVDKRLAAHPFRRRGRGVDRGVLRARSAGLGDAGRSLRQLDGVGAPGGRACRIAQEARSVARGARLSPAAQTRRARLLRAQGQATQWAGRVTCVTFSYIALTRA